MDWNERLKPNLGMSAHDSSLLGDQVDLGSGALSFENVDVSIPGNSDLPVEIRRRVNPGQWLNNEFADWYLDIPRITTNINGYEFIRGSRWGKNRCSQPIINSIPLSYSARGLDSSAPPLQQWQYNNGINLDVPGLVSTTILDKGNTTNWPATASKVTIQNWYLTCIANIDGSGTEGFYAAAPNGNKYKFNAIGQKNVSNTDLWRVYTGQLVNYNVEQTYLDILFVSEVVDVHGNWVKYNYDNLSRLTSITSNDNRTITLEYLTTSGRYIKAVTANPGTANELRWTYSYKTKTSSQWTVPGRAYHQPTIANKSYYVLDTVTRPDGKFWSFNLAGLYAKAIPGVSYEYKIQVNGETKASGLHAQCKQEPQVVSIIHPDGTKGEFFLEERKHFLPISVSGPYGSPCPKTISGNTTLPFQDVMSIVKKRLTSPSIPESIWTYSYFSPGVSGETNGTTIISPNNSKRINYYYDSTNLSSLIKSEIYAEPDANLPIEKTEYFYFFEAAPGSSFISLASTWERFRPIRNIEKKVTRSNDWYTTRNTFVTDPNASNYSYGFPIKVDKLSSLGGGTRTTNITYLKDADDWILGLTDRVVNNGALYDDYDYDTKGRMIAHKQFNNTIATLTYHTTGNQAGKLSGYRDGQNRQTYFSNYYRGVPKLITRADNTQFSRDIDENGRVTKEIDWRGNTTNYQYNNSGYLTLIDLQYPWTDTSINYDYYSSGLTQTITKGSDQTVNAFNTLLQLTSSYHEDLDGGDVTETWKKYDVWGRETFTSLPQEGYRSPYGKESFYDALGRLSYIRETAPGGALLTITIFPATKHR